MDKRPWGGFAVLEERNAYKVKRIEVLRRKTAQLPEARKTGGALDDRSGTGGGHPGGERDSPESGQAVDIPQRAAHRIFNPGQDLLVFIEIQTGEYFGEDDIIRLEDDFGRLPK